MTGAKRPRDLRLDFFRGLAMFIILLAHTPGNGWTLWIPARFGFSDATEIFVFCSGMASSLAFGATFASHSWAMGAARIGFRVWQVYWAHIGMALAVALLLWTIDAQGWGIEGKRYVAEVPIVPLFERTGEALSGLLTLRWVPNYLDILPMYLVILALVPVVMAAHRAGGARAALGLVWAFWLAANLGWADLPSRPWAPEIPWFFNPFGWSLVFFTGFALGVGWVRPPPVTRGLMRLAAAVLILSVPFAWFRIHDGLYLPEGWRVQVWIAEARAATEFLWRKTEMGLFRWLHFLALAYLAWALVGPGGRVLTEGFRPPRAPSRAAMGVAGALTALTVPWVYVDDFRAWAPGVDAAFTWAMGDGARAVLGTDLFLPWERIGLMSLIHVGGLLVLAWGAAGPRGREALCGPLWRGTVPVIRKVGTQSLAVFLTSMVLAQANGWWMDLWGREAWKTALVNLTGFGVLIATAYLAGFFKSQPWRKAPAVRKAPSAAPGPAE